MINVSNEFKQLMKEKTDFKEQAQITLQNRTVLDLSERDFTISNNSIVDGTDTNGLPLGVAISKHIQIEIMNDADQYSEYDFFGAKIRLYLTFQLSNSVETIEKGTFTVITPETYGTTITISAVDDMYRAEKSYQTSLQFPATAKDVLIDACATCDISLKSTSFDNDNFVISSKPSADMTFRQVIGYIAMISGGNARIDRFGYLEIVHYNQELFKTENLNGGGYIPWNGSNADGGNFETWSDGDVYDGGQFGDREEFHVLKNWINIKVDTDDVVITGIKTDVEDVEYISGMEGYVLSIENPLILGKEQELIDYLGSLFIGMRFRGFSGDLTSNPLIEFMDPALLVDRKGNMYGTYITNVDFTFLGLTGLKNGAEPPVRNSSKYYSEATKTLIKAKELVEKEKTNRELAVEQLAQQLANSSGLFMTTVEQPDNSFIYYMHDKPTLEESMVIWKLTALAFGISTDGGKTYPYGFTVDGTTITRLLYAEGIDADYINTGSLKVSDKNGNTIFKADYDTNSVEINADAVKVGSKKITDELEEISASVNANANSITAEVTRAKNAENTLSSRVNITEREISTVVSDGYLSSTISQESGKIRIRSNRFELDSDYTDISQYGEITCSNMNVTGGIFEIEKPSDLANAFVVNGPTKSMEMNATNLYSTSGSDWLVISTGTSSFNDMNVKGNLSVVGTKNRVVDTENYGKVGMNAFETMGSYFADIGSAVIVENSAVVFFDSTFNETIEENQNYQVLITSTSEKKIGHVKKSHGYFEVFGETGATFDWMIIAVQKNYSGTYGESVIMEENNIVSKPYVEIIGEKYNVDYDKIYNDILEQQEREVTLI